MQIVSATSAFPKHYYSQETLFEALQQYWGDQLEKPEVLRRLHKNVGVDSRFLSLPIDAYSKLQTWGEANDHWIRTAQELGHCAISRAITAAGLDVRDIGGGRHDLWEREFLQWLVDRGITPYMRTRDSIHRKRSPFFGPERFTYEPEHNRYLCPAGQPLNYGGRAYRNRAFNYIGTRKRCGACALKAQCTSAPFRSLNVHQQEPARQRARELANTPEFARAQRQRKKVEALFAELKNQIGLRRLRLRRFKFVREQFFMAAAAQNLKRLVRFLSQPPASRVLAT